MRGDRAGGDQVAGLQPLLLTPPQTQRSRLGGVTCGCSWGLLPCPITCLIALAVLGAAAAWPSPASASGGYSGCTCGLLYRGASSRRTGALGRGTSAVARLGPQLWLPGLSTGSVGVAPGLVAPCRGIFSDQGSTRVPCIGRQVLNQWTTRAPLIMP